MSWLISAFVDASTGAGAAAIGPIRDFIISLLIAVAGIGIIAALIWRGVQFAGEHGRENIATWLLSFVFGVVLIAGSNQIATGITGFAGGATVGPASPVLANEILGYVLGDLLWDAVWGTTLMLVTRHGLRLCTRSLRHAA